MLQLSSVPCKPVERRSMAVAAVRSASTAINVTATTTSCVATTFGTPTRPFGGPANLRTAHGALNPVAAFALCHEHSAIGTLHRLSRAQHLLQTKM